MSNPRPEIIGAGTRPEAVDGPAPTPPYPWLVETPTDGRWIRVRKGEHYDVSEHALRQSVGRWARRQGLVLKTRTYREYRTGPALGLYLAIAPEGETIAPLSSPD